VPLILTAPALVATISHPILHTAVMATQMIAPAHALGPATTATAIAGPPATSVLPGNTRLATLRHALPALQGLTPPL